MNRDLIIFPLLDWEYARNQIQRQIKKNWISPVCNYLISFNLAAFPVKSLINPMCFLLTLKLLIISIFSIVGEWIAKILSTPNGPTFLLTVIVFSKAVFPEVVMIIPLYLWVLVFAPSIIFWYTSTSIPVLNSGISPLMYSAWICFTNWLLDIATYLAI